jgi:hypothetical protein
MAYVAKAQRTPPEWIARRELLTIVCAANPGKDDAACWRQVADAIGDRELPVRWRDARPGWPSPITSVADEPQTGRAYWLNVEIDPSNPDAVLAPRPYASDLVDRRTAARLARARRFRIPLFSHAAALRCWPPADAIGAESAGADADIGPRSEDSAAEPSRVGEPGPAPLPEIAASDKGEEPTPPTPSGIRTTRAKATEVACGDWIGKLTERPRNKDAAFEDAKDAVKHIGPLSRKAFERAWAVRTPSAWKEAGARKGG